MEEIMAGKVTFRGRLGTNPTYFAGDTQDKDFVSFRFAESHYIGRGAGGKAQYSETEWFTVNFCGSEARDISKSFKKGDLIDVRGVAVPKSWNTPATITAEAIGNVIRGQRKLFSGNTLFSAQLDRPTKSRGVNLNSYAPQYPFERAFVAHMRKYGNDERAIEAVRQIHKGGTDGTNHPALTTSNYANEFGQETVKDYLDYVKNEQGDEAWRQVIQDSIDSGHFYEHIAGAVAERTSYTIYNALALDYVASDEQKVKINELKTGKAYSKDELMQYIEQRVSYESKELQESNQIQSSLVIDERIEELAEGYAGVKMTSWYKSNFNDLITDRIGDMYWDAIKRDENYQESTADEFQEIVDVEPQTENVVLKAGKAYSKDELMQYFSEHCGSVQKVLVETDRELKKLAERYSDKTLSDYDVEIIKDSFQDTLHIIYMTVPAEPELTDEEIATLEEVEDMERDSEADLYPEDFATSDMTNATSESAPSFPYFQQQIERSR
jgi:single-stranded DNA-binding protein